MKKVKR